MQDFGPDRREIQQRPGSRKCEILDPQLLLHPAYGLAAVTQHSRQSSCAADTPERRGVAFPEARPTPHPGIPAAFVRDLQHLGIRASLDANCQPAVISQRTKCVVQIDGRSLGPSAQIRGRNLQNAKLTIDFLHMSSLCAVAHSMSIK